MSEFESEFDCRWNPTIFGKSDLHNGSDDATATTSSLASLKSRMVLPFWDQLTQVVLEKRLLNGCTVVVVINIALCHLYRHITNRINRQSFLPGNG